MSGKQHTDFGPGWYDVAQCARVLENDYGVAVVCSLVAGCPRGHTELGLHVSVEAHARGPDGAVEVLFHHTRFRPPAAVDTVPKLLYGLLVCKLADDLENWRKRQRIAQHGIFPEL